jgi:hypothetical protein
VDEICLYEETNETDAVSQALIDLYKIGDVAWLDRGKYKHVLSLRTLSGYFLQSPVSRKLLDPNVLLALSAVRCTLLIT